MNNPQLYYFTIDSPAKATARLYGEVGCEIMPSIFTQELAYLETNGITEFDIRINSCGGGVVDGMTMFSALRSSKAKITTYNDGLCASTAGWVFLAGNEAVMMDYSNLMMHNPFGSDGSAKGNEIVETFRKSIVTILAARSGQTEKKITEMMDKETWLSAGQALSLGFATRIEKTDLLLTLEPEKQSVQDMLLITNSAIKQLTIKNMEDNAVEKDEVSNEVESSEVTNATEITDETVTVEVADEVTEPEAKVEEVVEDTEKTSLKLQNEELAKKHAEAMAKIAEMEIVLNAFNEEKALKEAEAAKVKVNKLINSAIEAGKIGEDSRAKFEALANKDFAAAEMAFDVLPASGVRKAVNIMEQAQVIKDSKELPSLRELQKTDPKKVERMLVENRALYAELYKKQYGVEWQGGPLGAV